MQPPGPVELSQHARDTLDSSNEVDEDPSLLWCAVSFTVTDVSEAPASYIFGVTEVHNGCHTRQDSNIFHVPHPEDGDSTVPRTVANHTATSSWTRISE